MQVNEFVEFSLYIHTYIKPIIALLVPTPLHNTLGALEVALELGCRTYRPLDPALLPC